MVPSVLAKLSFSVVSLSYAGLLWSVVEAASIKPSSDLVISNKLVSPDGLARTATLAGGTLPGPLIKATKGEKFKINVINKLNDGTMRKSTSIHWHGLFQKGTNWADGPAFINQCPIAANHSFLYEFSSTDQTNTYWYHSHLATQYCDGLRGPIVIYDPQDPHKSLYDIDDESTIIALMDWYTLPANTTRAKLFADGRLRYHFPSPQAGLIPTSNSTLINGLGRYPGGPASPLSIITVEHGKRYRMRLLNMACDPNYMFQIDHHTSLTVIEADGNSIVPHVVDSIQIFVGQRYSFVLHADQPIGNYWIRANANRGPVGFDGNINKAILRYKGAKAIEPTTRLVNSTKPIRDQDLVPLGSNLAAPGKPYIGGADHPVNLVLGVNDANTLFIVNGYSFKPPSVPILLQILSGARAAQELMPERGVIPLPSNKVIEVSIPAGDNAPGTPHPFHLHGHTFSVVRGAGSNATNFVNPVQRDVVSTGDPGDNVTIRFVTDNAGPWFLHCHIDWHLDAGLAIVFAEDTPHTKEDNPEPPAWDQLCPIYDSLSPDQL